MIGKADHIAGVGDIDPLRVVTAREEGDAEGTGEPAGIDLVRHDLAAAFPETQHADTPWPGLGNEDIAIRRDTQHTRVGQAVSQKLDLESVRHKRRGTAARRHARGVGDRWRGAGFGQILRADQPDHAGLVGVPAAVRVLALQHGFCLRAGAGCQNPCRHHHERNMNPHVIFLPDFSAKSHVSSCPHDVQQRGSIVLENNADRCDTL